MVRPPPCGTLSARPYRPTSGKTTPAASPPPEAELDEAAFAAAWAEGYARPLGDAVGKALALAREMAEPAATTRPRRSPTDDLSPREIDVLRLLADGRTDREIAGALAISPRTVARHVTAILAKLGVATRTAAATLAVRERLL